MTILEHCQPTLPSHWYVDASHHRRELEAVWYREWICVARQEDIPGPGDYVLVKLGSQQLILTRDRGGAVRAFHNTCRHRGSVLCRDDAGRFRNGRIVCPYHAWTYSLDGDLIATPKRLDSDDFDLADYPLYSVHVDSWGGFLFVNLCSEPSTDLESFLGEDRLLVHDWPLQELVSAGRESHHVACNWKVFWENYSECYHCPGVHPELCRLVPVYGEGLIERADAPGWDRQNDADTGAPRLADGTVTWSPDGQTRLPDLPGLGEAQRNAGMTFATFLPSIFLVAHRDYVRSVRMLPRGPESTELIVDWMVPPAVQHSHGEELDKIKQMGRLVVTQDAQACELNQSGLRCRAHRQGVLVPQEHGVWQFHQWLRDRLPADA
jgi:Rieske 2Fe-2S family protein